MSTLPRKAHYFDDASADPEDYALKMCVGQGYVPRGCLLAGFLVWGCINKGEDPCAGCAGPRARCHGRPKNDKELP